MAYGEPPGFQVAFYVGVEGEEAQGVGDRCARLADAARDFFLREAEIFLEALVGGGFFDGVEVLALEVFDECEFEDFAVGGRADDGWCFFEGELEGGAPATFAGDKLEGVADFANDEGLNDAFFADAFDEFLELVGAEFLAWLERTWYDLADGEHLDALAEFFDRGRGSDAGVDECAQAFTECLFYHSWRMPRDG